MTAEPPPDPEVLGLFVELAAIPSPPGSERAVADRVLAYLAALGLDVEEDGAGPEIGSDTGNLLSRIDATDSSGEPILLCAHLDTVVPTGPIEPVVVDGVVRNAAGTILGADNKATVAAMLVAARRLLEEGTQHAGVELLFTPKEEVGLVGIRAFDSSRLRASVGFVYDHAAPIGTVILGAPSAHTMTFRFRGRAAHSGMAPEEGRSAIVAAGRAVADMRLGRIDDETTANVGQISGGTARNVVPDLCVVEAEARSHDERKLADLVHEMLEAAAFAASACECELDTELSEQYRGYRFRRGDPAVRLAVAGLARAGFEPTFVFSGGAADANILNERGLPCVNLANGMAEIHTADEHVAVTDLERMVDVTLALVGAARDASLA